MPDFLLLQDNSLADELSSASTEGISSAYDFRGRRVHFQHRHGVPYHQQAVQIVLLIGSGVLFDGGVEVQMP
jgi:hypothetical protein